MDFYHQLILPWADAVRGLGANDKKFQAHAWRFPKAAEQAAKDQAVAKSLGYRIDDQWMMRHSMSPALDRRDDWLLVRGKAQALIDELEVTGQWPEGPFIALGTHWGAGLPTLAHLHIAKRHPCFVYRPEPAEVFVSRSQRWAHAIHIKAMEKMGGMIALGGAYRQIMDALASNKTPVILMDAPAEGRPTLTGSSAGYQLVVRAGLLQMLCKEGIRFAFYRCGFDPVGHKRQLHIDPVRLERSPQAIADVAAAHLKEALSVDAAQWRLWMVAASVLGSASQ